MVISILLLFLGFILMISGAGKLVDAASSLARRFNIPEIVIGLTIVSLGTSTPELVVNIVASSHKESAMVLGNVVGSNLFNVLMILGITSLAGTLTVKRNTTWLEIPLSLLGAIMVFIVASDKWLDGESFNQISRTDGFVLVSLALIFLVYNLELAKKENEELHLNTPRQRVIVSVFWLLAGMAGLIFGGRLIVDNAVTISRSLGISERIIAITVISVGTSLPELVTSLIAVKKKKVDLAIGNVVGSNIINVFFVLGISAIINPVRVDSNAFPDIYLNMFVGALLFVFLFFNPKRQLQRINGIIFILIYTGYILFLLFPDKFKI